MLTLSIAVSHTPWIPLRRFMLQNMEMRMGGLLTIKRTIKAYRVEKDLTRKGLWPTVKAAWEFGLYAGATHHMVMSDDAVLCKNFLPAMLALIQARPEHIISPTDWRKEIVIAKEQGKHWVVSCKRGYGLAAIMPTPFVKDFLTWEKAHIKPEHKWDDTRILYWAMERKYKLWFTSPSLVDHGAPNASACGNNHPARTSPYYIGCDADPLAIDWAGAASNPLVIPSAYLSAKDRAEAFL